MAASALQEHAGTHLRKASYDPTNVVGAGAGGRLQQTVQSIGSLAKDSKAAYSLAVLFALATPFGFASPEQAATEAAAKLQRQQQAAQAAQAASSRGSSSLTARLVANTKAQSIRRETAASTLRAVPPFWQLAGFAVFFATGGYFIDQGDSLNGSGVVSAWSMTYLLFRTIPTIKVLPRSPLALVLSTSVVTLGLGIHGCHYFDRTSWKGAVPGFSTGASGRQESAVAASRLFSGRSSDGSSISIAPPRPQSLLSSWKQEGIEATHHAEQRLKQTAERVVDGTQELLSPSRANNDEARAMAFLRRETKAQESI